MSKSQARSIKFQRSVVPLCWRRQRGDCNINYSYSVREVLLQPVVTIPLY